MNQKEGHSHFTCTVNNCFLSGISSFTRAVGAKGFIKLKAGGRERE